MLFHSVQHPLSVFLRLFKSLTLLVQQLISSLVHLPTTHFQIEFRHAVRCHIDQHFEQEILALLEITYLQDSLFGKLNDANGYFVEPVGTPPKV